MTAITFCMQKYAFPPSQLYFNPRVSNLHHSNSISAAIMHLASVKLQCDKQLSSFTSRARPRPGSVTEPDKAVRFYPSHYIYHIKVDMWQWTRQAEPANWLRHLHYLCLRDICDFLSYPISRQRGQEIRLLLHFLNGFEISLWTFETCHQTFPPESVILP